MIAGKFINEKVKARFEGYFPVLEAFSEITYMDVAPNSNCYLLPLH